MNATKRKFPNWLLPSLGVVLLLVGLFACNHASADSDGDSDTQPAAQKPSVEIITQEGRRAIWQVEIADTNAERMRGLMYRDTLAKDAGMLFLFPYESIQSFWMKNTRIPLDMIFIRKNKTVAGVAHNATPYDTSSYAVDTPSQYVLEINGGQAKALGIQKGDTAIFHDIGD